MTIAYVVAVARIFDLLIVTFQSTDHFHNAHRSGYNNTMGVSISINATVTGSAYLFYPLLLPTYADLR